MAKTPPSFRETPSQTAGPYVHIGLAPHAAGIDAYRSSFGQQIFAPDTESAQITISGHIADGDGALVKDALIEIWQADAQGIYDPKGHAGWGRVTTDLDSGQFTIRTIKPGATTTADGLQSAPHLVLWIVARGVNIGLSTRLYFSDEETANATDPQLTAISDARRRATLIAQKNGGGYHFDICLQGAEETVFFDD